MTPTGPAEMRVAGDGHTLVGYPVVFNDWTEIQDWGGAFLERIDPGALDKTLAERGDRVKVLFNHGQDPTIGDKPLGKPTVLEARAKGLYLEVPLSGTSYNDDLKALFKDKAIDGMSMRFGVLREDTHTPDEATDHNPDRLEERTITEMRLYEVGPVVFPAYEGTTVGVRSVWQPIPHPSLHRGYDPRMETKPDPAPPRGTPEKAADTPPSRHLSLTTIHAKRRVMQQELRS
jgi:HK97 family phage prohead protease